MTVQAFGASRQPSPVDYVVCSSLRRLPDLDLDLPEQQSNGNIHLPICRYPPKYSEYEPEGGDEKPKHDKRGHEGHSASFSLRLPEATLIGPLRAAGLRYSKIPSAYPSSHC